MKVSLTIELERNELKALRVLAARQLRTPENMARFLILKQMGFIYEDPVIDAPGVVLDEPDSEQ